MSKSYPPAEERLNILSHALGLLASMVALVLLVQRAMSFDSPIALVSFTVFGLSLITLYGVSTAYHSATDPDRRLRLRVADHAAIYILIAGTYTPLALVTLAGSVGNTIFAVTWLMAITGIVLKLFFTGRFDLLSTLMYVFMGWLIVFAINPIIESLPLSGLVWLVSGGLAYTVGAVLYAIKALPFNHAIFHGFVLLGSFCHFVVVYAYVIPA